MLKYIFIIQCLGLKCNLIYLLDFGRFNTLYAISFWLQKAKKDTAAIVNAGLGIGTFFLQKKLRPPWLWAEWNYEWRQLNPGTGKFSSILNKSSIHWTSVHLSSALTGAAITVPALAEPFIAAGAAVGFWYFFPTEKGLGPRGYERSEIIKCLVGNTKYKESQLSRIWFF